MLVKIKELDYIIELMKKEKPKKGTVEKMIGKFPDLIPKRKSSVDFIKEIRNEQHD